MLSLENLDFTRDILSLKSIDSLKLDNETKELD